jgi:hypothetical protein
MDEGRQRLVELDTYFYLRIHQGEQGTCIGEVIRGNADAGDPATHVFDVPPQANAKALEDWAVRALQAYREG